MNERAHPLTVEREEIGQGGRSGALLGAGAVVIWNDIHPEGRDAFYAWHDKEHMPERLALPGFRRGRRYRRDAHSPEWLTLYEAANRDALSSPAYLARLNAPTPQTTATLRHFANTSRAVCRVAHSVGSSSGGFVLALRLDRTGEASAPREAAEEPGHQHEVVSALFARAMDQNGIVACHYFVSDATSFTNTAESSTRRFDVPVAVVLAEATHAAAAERVRPLFGAAAWAPLGLAVRSDAAVYALEICRLAQADSGPSQYGEA